MNLLSDSRSWSVDGSDSIVSYVPSATEKATKSNIPREGSFSRLVTIVGTKDTSFRIDSRINNGIAIMQWETFKVRGIKGNELDIALVLGEASPQYNINHYITVSVNKLDRLFSCVRMTASDGSIGIVISGPPVRAVDEIVVCGSSVTWIPRPA